MSKTYLSLDIRDQSISGFLVKSGLKGNSIEGHVRVPVEAAEESENQLESPWHQAISVIVDQLDTNGAICLITVPPALISYRNIRIPFKENRKIRQVLPFEVEPLLPFPLDEVILDFQTARQSENSDVIAAAVEKAKLQPILDALAAFHLSPQVIIPGGFPVALYLANQKEEDSFIY